MTNQAIPHGWRLVPAEMTLDMSIAFAEAWYSKSRAIDDHEMQDAYAAMLAAAPSPGADTEATVQLSGHPGEMDESLRFSAQRILDAAFHWAEQRQIGPAQAKSAWVGLERHVLMQLRSQRYDRASRPAATAVSAEPVAKKAPRLVDDGSDSWDGARKRTPKPAAPPAADERALVGDERAAIQNHVDLVKAYGDQLYCKASASNPTDKQSWSKSAETVLSNIAKNYRAALASAPVAGENGAQSTQNRPESRANTGYTGGTLAPVAGEVNAALDEWLDKTDFIQERIASGDLPVKYLGWHRADVMRDLIDDSKTEPLNAAPQASTAADARDALAWGVIENARAAMDASFESGDESLGVSVPSHLAAALCLALDELDAIVAKQGEGETA
ncbi:hypothetical protein [Bordetella avium]|uniref:hypothetical protein n=3 Tax=Bordetella avium TaxID=521 RepID=UPI000E0B7BD6|nr:hypothetical protein [Bordetella avium]RIQ50827.1 hypothetical protein D0844_14945 [Bordetella avium]RIQ58506.1 hypothetical protein D0840_17095 [Bordetella avium]WQE34239.1 hypothetical protein U0029_03420 [Bordetella avium]SUV67831.1 phage protein [Bordetella avium]